MPPTLTTAAPDTKRSLSGDTDDRGSSRSLDEVGAFAVLGAMVEQRRRSNSVPALDDDEPRELVFERVLDSISDAFMKIR